MAGRLAKRAWHRSIAFLAGRNRRAHHGARVRAAPGLLVLAQARPLVFGFLPIGLFYHAAYTVAISLFMWFLVRRHWPSHLEESAGE